MQMINSSETRLVNEKQYQKFTNFVNDNYKELYENKVCYEINRTGDNFFITLFENDIANLSDIFDVSPMAWYVALIFTLPLSYHLILRYWTSLGSCA